MDRDKKIKMRMMRVLADWLAEYLSGDAIHWLHIFNKFEGDGDDVVVYQFLESELDEDADFDRLLWELKKAKGR